MTFPTAETSRSLAYLDLATGSRTVESFGAVTELYPHLGRLAITLDSRGLGAFHGNEAGLDASSISMNSDPRFYQAMVDDPLIKIRTAEAAKLFEEHGASFRLPELVTTILLHELGHAEQLHEYTEKNGGDTKAAFQLLREIQASGLASLPLKRASTGARRAWNDNVNGYRDRMMADGYTEELFQQVLVENTIAYGELTLEHAADRFGLGALATVYS